MSCNKYYDTQRISTIDRLLSKRKLRDAFDEINKYKKEYPQDYLIYLYYAWCLSLMGKRDSALDIARINIKRDFRSYKNTITAYTLYGNVMEQNDQVEEAIEYYKKAIDLSIEENTVAKARIKLINLYTSRCEYEKALELCEGHDHLNNILVKKANILSSLKQYDKALDCLNKIQLDKVQIDHNPNYYMLQDIYYLFGDSYLRINPRRIEQAKKYLNMALSPKDSTTYARVLADLGYIAFYDLDYNTAMNYANRIITETNNAYYGYELLTSIYTELNEKDKAIQTMECIKNGYRYNQKKADFNYATKDYPEAERYICKVLGDDLSIDHEMGLTKYALILFRLGKTDTLRSLYNNIIIPNNYSNESLQLVKEYIDHIDDISTKDSYIKQQYDSYKVEEVKDYLNCKDYINNLLNKLGINNIGDLYDVLSNMIIDMEYTPYGFYDKYYIKDMDIVVLTLPSTKNIVTIYQRDYEDTHMNDKCSSKQRNLK